MTKQQLGDLKGPLSLDSALRLAFEAGVSYGIASHPDFTQIHEPGAVVCEAIMRAARKRGREKTTGRFDTRAQLVERVLYLYQDTSCSNARIARNCHISETTVAKIIKEKK